MQKCVRAERSRFGVVCGRAKGNGYVLCWIWVVTGRSRDTGTPHSLTSFTAQQCRDFSENELLFPPVVVSYPLPLAPSPKGYHIAIPTHVHRKLHRPPPFSPTYLIFRAPRVKAM